MIDLCSVFDIQHDLSLELCPVHLIHTSVDTITTAVGITY